VSSALSKDRLQTIFLGLTRGFCVREIVWSKNLKSRLNHAGSQMISCTNLNDDSEPWSKGRKILFHERRQKGKASPMTSACKQIYRIGVPITCAKITIEEAEARIVLQWLHRALSPSHQMAMNGIVSLLQLSA